MSFGGARQRPSCAAARRSRENGAGRDSAKSGDLTRRDCCFSEAAVMVLN